MSFKTHASCVKNNCIRLIESSWLRFAFAVLLACFVIPGLSAEAQLKLRPQDQGSTAKSENSNGSGTKADGSGTKADGSGTNNGSRGKTEGSGSKADGSGTNNGSSNKTDGSGSSNGSGGSDGKSGKVKVPPGQLFRVMLQRIRENEGEINRLYSTMPLGFKEKQDQYLARIDKLGDQTARLKADLPSAAIEAFKVNPGKDPAVTQYVIRILNQLIEPTLPDSVFGPKTALEIVDSMLDAGADKDVVVLSKGFRASYALDDFDRASLMLDRIHAVKPQFDLAGIRKLVEESTEKWQRELTIRRLEKNNDNLPKVKFETTAGNFVVALYEDYAPNTVANFISLVQKKFYNDLTFHYVKPGEYIHGGCPNGDGSGGPGYTIASEFDREQARHFFSGTLGMANTGKNSEGSQFVITHQPLPQLDNQFTAFGRVIEGFNVILNFKAIDPRNPVPAGGVPAQPVRIIKAEVLWTRDHEYEPQKFEKQSMGDVMDNLDGSDSKLTPGSGTKDAPGSDTKFTPGSGTKDASGSGTTFTPGSGTKDTSGSGTTFTPGSGTKDSPPINGGDLFSPSNP